MDHESSIKNYDIIIKLLHSVVYMPGCSGLSGLQSRRETDTAPASVKRNFWPLRKFWPVIVCQLFCFSERRNKVWRLLFQCVLWKSKHFG